ncbi:MAG: type II methionyl aminopeptidase [Thermoplasmata archaeon]|nr:MAG: type II methionyl aminopeptidase [Thermoplasmata archaeon]
MDDEIYEKYRLAGKIAADALKYGVSLIKPGVKLLKVADLVEKRIIEKNAGLAFPVNISINDLAAHFSPKHNDTNIFKKGDVVKLDVGAHIDGYIADTATTVEVQTDRYKKMIQASREALNRAISTIKAGINISHIGEVVETAISSYGYKPIDNLNGHGMRRYVLHSGVSIPSISGEMSISKTHIGDVLAIEPFATDGAGHVISGEGSNIYIYNETIRSRVIRNPGYRSLLKTIRDRFKTLPFAERWCIDLFPDNTEYVLKKLSFLGAIKQYPQLIEIKHGIVTQAEHTVIVYEDECEVIT